MVRPASRWLLVGAIGLVLVGACGEQTATPTGPSPRPASPPAPAAVVTAIRLEGPSSLSPGASAQYRVIASFSNGTVGDVTDRSTIPGFGLDAPVKVTDSGLVTGREQGEVNLVARYPAGTRYEECEECWVFGPGTLQSPPLRILVLEPGTFRVMGVVTESGRLFPNIHVTVVAGRRAGLTVSSDSTGHYAMYGLAGATDLAISEEGLQIATRSIVVTDHQTVDFDLQPLPGYDTLSGDWRLTISASPDCGSELPAIAATRTFDATITQRGPQLDLKLSSAAIVVLPDSNYFPHGGVSGNVVSIGLQSDFDNPPDWALLEMLEPRRFLGIGARLEGQRSGNTVTGWASGRFAVYRSAGPSYRAPTTVLESSCHRTLGKHDSLHSFRLERK